MLRLYHRLRNVGVSADLSAQEAKYVIATNVSALVVECITLPYFLLYNFIGANIPLWLYGFYGACITIYLFTFVLNHHRFYLTAKLVFLVTGFVHLLGILIMLDKSAYLDLYALAAFFVPFFIFHPKQKVFIFFSLLSLVAVYFAAQIYYDHYPPLVVLQPGTLEIFRVVSVSLVMAWLAFQGYYFYSLANNVEAVLDRERHKSDTLLLNILPKQVASELKKDGKANPRHYESVSVLFTDFHGFTMIAEKMKPSDLVQELDQCFTYFDAIMDKQGLEKLKTIGDAYMCAGGLPEPNNTHAIDIAVAALDIVNFMERQREEREAEGRPYWQLRIGINTGPLVAGVIGQKKFAYDVWGDTVNTAARMESAGARGKINISKSTYELIRQYFDCTHRGKLEAKNKGEIDMYFLDSLKAEYRNEAGEPNQAFWQSYREV